MEPTAQLQHKPSPPPTVTESQPAVTPTIVATPVARRGPRLFLVIPVATLVVVTAVWGGPHHLWMWSAWSGHELFPPFDYIAAGPIGRAFELVYWVNWAVQLRWIGHSLATYRRKSRIPNQLVMMWLFDTLNTPFISWILLVLLQGLSISVTDAVRLSLADVDVTLFSALSALLGMSVRETRALLTQMAHATFRRFGHDKQSKIE